MRRGGPTQAPPCPVRYAAALWRSAQLRPLGLPSPAYRAIQCVSVTGAIDCPFQCGRHVLRYSRHMLPPWGGLLGEGELHGAIVTCPWHGATFDVQTGAVTGPRPARVSLAFASASTETTC